MITEAGEVCDACHAAMTDPGPSAPPMAVAAVAAGVIPFFVSVSEQSSVTSPGMTTTSYLDYVALVGGVAALLLGAVAAVPLLRATPRNARALAIAGGAVMLGLVQMLRAFGKIA